MSDTKEYTDDKLRLETQNVKLKSSIMMAAEMETTFKLYSYRCLSPEAFVSRVEELMATYKYSTDPSNIRVNEPETV